MDAGFYRAAVLLAATLACWGCDRPEQPRAGEGTKAPIEGGAHAARARYVPPPDGDLVGRWIEKLEAGSREGLHYALERLAEHGTEAAPRLAARLRQVLDSGDRGIGLPHNLCVALGGAGAPESAAVLVETLQRSPVPVVRSAAAEALGILGTRAAVPRLVEQLARETELGPRLALLGALGRLGGAEAGEFLAAAVDDWLAGRGESEFGEQAWNNLLLLKDAGALARLQQIAPRVAAAPPLRLQLLVARMELGERGLVAEVRAFLDPDRYPSGKVRALAVAGLAEAGAWADVLTAARDPSPLVRQAVAEALGRPEAASRDLGRSFLREAARPGDLELLLRDDRELQLAVVAARVLLARGERSVLDPWLRLLRGFPAAAGSVQALAVLKEPELLDPRTAPILIRRWPATSEEQRVDVLRALAVLGDTSVLGFYERVIAEEEGVLQRLAVTTVANLGPAACELLEEVAARTDLPELAASAVVGLGRLARGGHEPARRFLRVLAVDRLAPAAVRSEAIRILPRALGEEAFEVLLGAWRSEPPGPVREALDETLTRAF